MSFVKGFYKLFSIFHLSAFQCDGDVKKKKRNCETSSSVSGFNVLADQCVSK